MVGFMLDLNHLCELKGLFLPLHAFYRYFITVKEAICQITLFALHWLEVVILNLQVLYIL